MQIAAKSVDAPPRVCTIAFSVCVEVAIDKLFIFTHTLLQNDCTGKLETDSLQDKLVHYMDYSCSFFVL